MTDRILITEQSDGSYKHCSETEIALALASEAYRLRLEKSINRMTRELERVKENCKHPVCYDEPGMPYNFRVCLVCGHISTL